MYDQRAIDVGLGRRPADKVFSGGRLVNVFTAEVYEADVAIAGDRIAAIGDVSRDGRAGHRDHRRLRHAPGAGTHRPPCPHGGHQTVHHRVRLDGAAPRHHLGLHGLRPDRPGQGHRRHPLHARRGGGPAAAHLQPTALQDPVHDPGRHPRRQRGARRPPCGHAVGRGQRDRRDHVRLHPGRRQRRHRVHRAVRATQAARTRPRPVRDRAGARRLRQLRAPATTTSVSRPRRPSTSCATACTACCARRRWPTTSPTASRRSPRPGCPPGG